MSLESRNWNKQNGVKAVELEVPFIVDKLLWKMVNHAIFSFLLIVSALLNFPETDQYLHFQRNILYHSCVVWLEFEYDFLCAL
jgi:hypothetical protein